MSAKWESVPVKQEIMYIREEERCFQGVEDENRG